MAVSDALKIIGKTGTSPDEFEVQLPLQICEAFKNLPELHNLRILRIATAIFRDLLQLFKVNNLITACTLINLIPGEKLEVFYGNHEINALDDILHLVLALFEASLAHQLDVLIKVFFGQLDLSTTTLKFDFHLVGEVSGEVLLDGRLKILV